MSSLDKNWRTSTKCTIDTHCVEVRFVDGAIEVRNSKKPEEGLVRFTRPEWEAFIGGVMDGEFRLPPTD